MLLLMTVTHVPTRFSEPLGQPFGFVSSAEGFVMLSACVAGAVYTRRQMRDGAMAMHSALFKRALNIYLCQLALLAFLLGFIAVIGVLTRQAAITNLVSFFLDNPPTAVFSGMLLLYNPPLLDILPMYIVFMLASPLVLLFGNRHGWRGLLVISGLVWLAAQFGLSQAGYDALVRLTGMPVPFRETGSFEMLAWQFLWMIGLRIGAGQTTGRPAQPDPFPPWAVCAALVIGVVHFLWRHWIGQTPFPDGNVLNLEYDKWQLGPMRLVDFFALMLLAMHFAPSLVRWLPRWRILETLGRQSLPVFCLHLVLTMAVLAAFGSADPHRPWLLDASILGACLATLFLAAGLLDRLDQRAAQLRHQRVSAPRATGQPA